MNCKFHFPIFNRNAVVVYPFKGKPLGMDAGAGAKDSASGLQPKEARVKDPAKDEGV